MTTVSFRVSDEPKEKMGEHGEITDADVAERNTAETVREWREARHGARSDDG